MAKSRVTVRPETADVAKFTTVTQAIAAVGTLQDALTQAWITLTFPDVLVAAAEVIIEVEKIVSAVNQTPASR